MKPLVMIILAAILSPQIAGPDRWDHNGGCRKASPAGQCCHMETAVNKVHCH